MNKPIKNEKLKEIAEKLQISRTALTRIALHNLISEFEVSGQVKISK